MSVLHTHWSALRLSSRGRPARALDGRGETFHSAAKDFRPCRGEAEKQAVHRRAAEEVHAEGRDFDAAVSRFLVDALLVDAVQIGYGVQPGADLSKLQGAGLLPDASALQFRRLILTIAIVALACVAGLKVLIALAHERTNVLFLIIMAIAAVVIAVKIANPYRTSLGSAYLQTMRGLFSQLPSRARSLQRDSGSSELLWLAALFGMSAASFAASGRRTATRTEDPPCESR